MAAGKYEELLEEAFTTLTSYLESEWTVVKQTGRVVVSCTPSSNGIKIYKAVGEITTTPKNTMEYILPGPNRVRRQWDDTVKEWNIIETIHESSIVLQSITKSVAWGLISSRDFVDLIKWGCIEESGLYYTCALGIDHPSCPESTKFVRGWNYPCGTFCFPIDNGRKSKVTYILQSDLRGRLPVSLVESSLPSMLVDTYNNLQAAIDKKLMVP